MNQANLQVTTNPAGPDFPISSGGDMPRIIATAVCSGFQRDPRLSLSYQWLVTLVWGHGGWGCPHAVGRRTQHQEIRATTTANSFSIPFTQVRGGVLTVEVEVIGASLPPTARRAATQNLRVVGTNPRTADLVGYVNPEVAFRKLMRHESRLRQFRRPIWPLFSADNLGGVGLCQITRPRPTDDEVWSWKANVDAGWRLYQHKKAAARLYPQQMSKSAGFKQLVEDYNQERVSENPKAKPLHIAVPPYTPEQLQRDTLRGFNGYAGRLHEYRLKLDEDGGLVVEEGSGGGHAVWERVSAAARIEYYKSIQLDQSRWGDPDYVDNVERLPSF